jgi:excisionase family DNA binding protein
MKNYLSVSQVCKRLPVGKSLVYRLITTGELPSTRFGSKILVPEDELISLLEKGTGCERKPTPLDPRPAPTQKRNPGGRARKLDLW